MLWVLDRVLAAPEGKVGATQVKERGWVWFSHTHKEASHLL